MKPTGQARDQPPTSPILVASALALTLGVLTLVIWRVQVGHGRSLLRQQTSDVAIQAARQIEAYLETHARVLNLFAKRWSNPERDDFSEARFRTFALLLSTEFPAFRAIALFPAGGDPGPVWLAPEGTRATWAVTAASLSAQHRADADDRPILSPPLKLDNGETGLVAVLMLHKGVTPLGTLAAAIGAREIEAACLPQALIESYGYTLRDGEAEVLRANRPGRPSQYEEPIAALNRRWLLSVAPLEDGLDRLSTVGLPALVLFLSAAVTALVFLLLRRMALLRLAHDAQIGLARKVLLAQEEERARLSRELHDELGQVLTAVRLELGWLERQVAQGTASEQGSVRNTVELLEQAASELRRLCKGLRPQLLDDLGLEPAVRQLVEEFEGRSEIPLSLQLEVDEALTVPREVALTAFRVLQESLTNIGRHARAAKVRIALEVDRKGLRLEIQDDGVGFDPEGQDPLQASGLSGMSERAALVGGFLEIRSSKGQGTTVLLTVPARATV